MAPTALDEARAGPASGRDDLPADGAGRQQDPASVPVPPQPEVGSTAPRLPSERILTAMAAALSVTAAAWMAGGLFRGGPARALAISAGLAAVGVVTASYRARRPSVVQYLTLPAAVAAGAIVATVASGGSVGELPSLVREAVQLGGLSQAPVPFDPGWRFVVVVLMAALGAAAMSVGMAVGRAHAAVLVTAPLILGAALLQPDEASLSASAVSLGLVGAALLFSHGAELVRDGAIERRFELRRVVTGTVILALAVGGLGGLSRVEWLFPEPVRERTVPPQRPEQAAVATDQTLFTVRADRAGPWRVGVLDVYDDGAWLLPPLDADRLRELADGGALPGDHPGRAAATATFTIVELEGRVLPHLANADAITGVDVRVTYDPRTQMLRLADGRTRNGFTYTVSAAELPDTETLAQAPPPGPEMAPSLAAPAPPNEVVVLLDGAPNDSAWARLQYVRAALYRSVIASGTGTATDVPPERVVEMLAGAEASPYEITAAEALLARWAGIPARIGYGYFGGDPGDDGAVEVGAEHGATWLEVHISGHGWMPVLGTPARVKEAFTPDPTRQAVGAAGTGALGIVVYVPVARASPLLVYELVRYWALRAAPLVVIVLLVWAFYPVVLKAGRRAWRRRWARQRGLRERIAVAYAEFRDTARDLNVGRSHATAVEFLDDVDPDDEHTELAWLVTRALWGDLRRDLRAEDADAAEAMARSVSRRLRSAQALPTVVAGLAARTSLREPYTPEIPNLWRARARRRRMRRGLAIGTLLGAVVLASCAAPDPVTRSEGSSRLADDLVPATLSEFTLHREAAAEDAFAQESSLVTEGRVYTMRTDGTVEAYLQIASLAAHVDASRAEIREGVLAGIATGRFEPQRLGTELIYTQVAGDRRLLLWFAPEGDLFQLMVVGPDLDAPEELFAALLAYQRDGGDPPARRPVPVLPDPRRGGEL